jgi:hypothetical protein
LVEFGGLPRDTFRAGQLIGRNKRNATAIANELARKLRKTMTRQEVKLCAASRIAAAWFSCPSAKLAEYGEGG